MAVLTESQALAILKRHLSPGALPARVLAGIGDDCAVLAASTARQVWTMDACLEGVHFRRDWLTLGEVAGKALNAAVSDLAAMGALPVAALCQLTLSPGLSGDELDAFARAQAEAAQALGCPIVGGNITRGDAFGVVTTALGELAHGLSPLTRSGAQVGDELWLVGEVGLARAGLLALSEGNRALELEPGRSAFRRPHALLKEGRELLGRASACLDVSDGLERDADNLARSSGVRVVIDGADLLQAVSCELHQCASVLGLDPLELALTGGEDYALLATGSPELRPACARRLGSIEEGSGAFLRLGIRDRALTNGFEHSAK